MQHFRNPLTILLFIVVTLVAMKWQVPMIVFGVMLFDQSLHESRHHPTSRLDNPLFEFLGIIIAGIGALWLR